jgi:hypothetical protein
MANHTNLLAAFLGAFTGPLETENFEMLSEVLQEASESPGKLNIILQAMTNHPVKPLKEVLCHMLGKLIAENEREYLIPLRNIYVLLNSQQKGLVIAMLVQAYFFSKKKQDGLQDLMGFLFTIARIKDRNEQLNAIAACVYDFLSRSSMKRKAQQMIDLIPYSDDLQCIITTILRFAAENDDAKIVSDLFRGESVAIFFSKEMINKLEGPVRAFVESALDVLKEKTIDGWQAKFTMWYAEKKVDDVESGVLQSFHVSFIAACQEYEGRQSAQPSSFLAAVKVARRFLEQQAAFRESVQVGSDCVDAFDKLSYQLLYRVVSQFAEDSNSRRFSLLLSKHLDKFPFLRESQESESGAKQYAIKEMRLLLEKAKNEVDEDVLVKSLQKRVFIAFDSKSQQKSFVAGKS